MEAKPAILLAGPTAVGKSEVALCLAERLGGELISVDSMQVYRGLDIGTAKPTIQDRGRVPHHLVDIVALSDAFDAAQFVRLAKEAIVQIQARGRLPLLCGGTGLYFKAFLEGLGESPPGDPTVRAELESKPLPELLNELAASDSLTYQTIDRRNPRRIVRALEVIRLTGKPFSQQRAAWDRAAGSPALASAASFGLVRSTTDLRRRIDLRVDEMFRRGLVAETAQLLERGLAQNRTALQALGYRQVVEHLQGRRSLAETIDLVKIRTRQFAKRQMTWFRRQLDLTWIQVEADAPAEAVAEQIASHGIS